MPGMKLGFVDNAIQRVAAHKSFPVHHLEAVIAYGAPNKRAAAMKKVVRSTPSLSLYKETHQLVLTVIDTSDSTVRCEILYAMRGKLKEVACSRFGNVVLQRLVEKLPRVQCREIAEAFKTEAADLARHMFGNRVLQKLAEREDAADVLAAAVMPDLTMLAVHPTAHHVVAALVRQGGTELIAEVASSDVLASLVAMDESAVLTALVNSVRVPDEVQIAARNAVLGQLDASIAEGKQHFAVIAAIEGAQEAELAQFVERLAPVVAELAQKKGMSAVVAALVRRCASAATRRSIVADAIGASVVEAACDPYRSLVVREAIVSRSLGEKLLAELVRSAGALATSAAGVVVFQRLYLTEPTVRDALQLAVADSAVSLAVHCSGTHAVQCVLEHAEADVREDMAKRILDSVSELLDDQQGTFVVQKALGAASPDVLATACEAIAEKVTELAFNPRASFSVAAALTAAKRAGLPQAKLLMDQLKPKVTDLATQPWVGRVVLDAMFQVGSAALKDAIRDVIFLKCEAFLSEAPSRTGTANERRPRSADGRGRAKRHNPEN